MSHGRLAAAWAVAALAFWAAWIVLNAFDVPLLWYLPLERRFTFGARPPGMTMAFYGQLLAGGLTAAAAGAATWGLVGERELAPSKIWLLAAACAVLLSIATGYMAWEMWGRVLT
jgi:hypothetical protein